MKKYIEYIKENIDDSDWEECPIDYEFSIGERVKMSPTSRFLNQANGERIGTISSNNKKGEVGEDTWFVNWDNGALHCYYWRKDLLVNKKFTSEFIKKQKELRLKHFDDDPFGEEIWKE